MIDTGTPYRVQPDLKTFFQKGVELMNLASTPMCSVVGCEEPPFKHTYCEECYWMAVRSGMIKG